MKILTDPDKANTLENTRKTDGSLDKQGWFTKAIQYDQIYRDARAAQQEDRRGNYNNDNKNRTFQQAVQKGNERSWRSAKPAPPYRDLNAMDIGINTMSETERAYLMKKGACFKCKEVGHMAREHDNFKKGFEKPRYSGNLRATLGSTTKKLDAKEIAKYICAMNKEEQNELFKEVEKDDNISDKAKDF